MNVDAFIARQNIDRAVNGQELDRFYLTGLSEDAVPVLVQKYQSEDIPVEVREEIGAVLVCQQTRINEMEVSQNKHWQSFHLSPWLAQKALDKVQDSLSSYTTLDTHGTITVISPDGTLRHVCQNTVFID
jgi:hypothetical protein